MFSIAVNLSYYLSRKKLCEMSVLSFVWSAACQLDPQWAKKILLKFSERLIVRGADTKFFDFYDDPDPGSSDCYLPHASHKIRLLE